MFQCLGRRNSSSFLVLSGESRLRVPRCFFGSDSGPQGHRYAAGAGSNRKRTLWRQGIVTTCELRFVAGSNSVSWNFIQSIPGSSTFFYFFFPLFPSESCRNSSSIMFYPRMSARPASKRRQSSQAGGRCECFFGRKMQRFWQKNVCKNQVSTTRNIGFIRIEVKVAEKLKKMRYHYLQNRLPKSSQQLRN